MTTNAFIFSWDQTGIESIIPITQYEKWDEIQTMEMLKGNKHQANPIGNTIGQLKMRARFNSQRHYEIYAIDCTEELDEEFWWERWKTNPQETADLIREKGVKIFCNRAEPNRIKIL